MKRIVLSVMAGLLLAGAAQAVPDTSGKGALAVVEIRGLENLVSAAQDLAMSFMFPATREMLVNQLSAALLTTNFAGVDAKGVIRIFAIADDAAEKSIPLLGLAIPVTGDGSEYLAQIGERVDKGGRVEGVESFIRKDRTSGIGKPAVFYAQLQGSSLLVAERVEAVKALADGILSGAISAEGLVPVEGVLALKLNPAGLIAYFEPQINKKMDQVQAAISKAKGDKAEAMDVGKVLDTEYEAGVGILKQLSGISLGLGITKEYLAIDSKLETVAGTTAEKVIASMQTPAPEYTSLAPANAYFAYAGDFGDWTLWMETYMSVMKEIYAAMGPEMEQFSVPLLDSLEKTIELYSGDVAFAMVPGTEAYPVQFVEMIGAKDTDALREQMTQMMSALAGLTGKEGAPPFEFKAGEPRTYQDIEIDSFVYSMNLDAAAMKDAPPVIRNLFANFKYEIAYLDDALLVSMGPPELMDQTIDRIEKGEGQPLAQSETFKRLFPDLGVEPTEIAVFSLLDAARAFLPLFPGAEPYMNLLPAAKGSFAGYSISKDGASTSSTRLALTDITAFFQSVMAMQATIQSQRQPPHGSFEMEEEEDIEAIEEDMESPESSQQQD